MNRHARRAAHTLPPARDPEDAIEGLAARTGSLKALALAAVALVGVGVAFAVWESNVAKQPDVARERDYAAGVAAELRKVDERVIRLEESRYWMELALEAIAAKLDVPVPPPPTRPQP